MDRQSGKTSRLFRLFQFLLVSVSVVSLLSGLRLTWLNHPDLPSWLFHAFDILSLRGPVLTIHMVAASAVVFIFSLGVYYLILSGEGKRLFSKKSGGFYSFEKCLNATLAFAVFVAGLTGIGMHNGWKSGFGFISFYRQLHLISTAVFLFCLLGLIYLLSHYIGRRTEAESRPASRFKFWPFTGAAIVAIGLLWAFNTTINKSCRLVSKEINRSIYVDGIIRPIEWLGSGEATFYINGKKVVIRAIHNRYTSYLAIRWADQTYSADRKMVKTESGWHEKKTEKKDIFGERVYYEDKLALSISLSKEGCAGTCHVRTEHSLGTHSAERDTIDLWDWQAVSSNPAAEADDLWIGLSADDSTNGIHTDNNVRSGAYINFNREWQEPFFLPLRVIEEDFIWIGSGMAMPYRAEQDTFKIGDEIPAILVENLVGDRGDVRGYGRWSEGYWELELVRKRRTGSPHDLNLLDTLYLNLAIFDNAEKLHDVQLQPIELIFE